jgi:hypothetical protein
MGVAAGYAHVEVGTVVFWDQVDPPDYDDGYNSYYEYEAPSRFCCVCGGSTEGSAWCGVGCYQLWNYVDEPEPFR